MDDLRRIGKALDDLNRVISASAKHGLAAQGEFMRTVDQILRTVENTRHEIVQRVDKFAIDLERQFQEGLRRLSDQHTKHIESLLIEHREETLKHLDRLRKDLTQD